MKQKEMQPIIDLYESGKIFLVRCPGCQLGYRDPRSGLPYKKPMEFWTTLATFRDKCATFTCQCAEHVSLLGCASRTRATAEWPASLDRLILDCLLEQIDLDTTPDVLATGMHQEETSGRLVRRRLRGKQRPEPTLPSPDGDTSSEGT